MFPTRVADAADPRLVLYRGVRDPELLREHGAFLAEGRSVVERLLRQSSFRARSVLVTPAAHESLAAIIASAQCPVYLVDPPIVQAITGYNIHRGCLAIGDRGAPRDPADLAASHGPLVMLEQVGNPDNIGGVFRNAAAFGATGVLLSPGCSDPLYRKSIRTSMGASLTVPFAIAEDWPHVIDQLRDSAWTVIALTLGAGAEDISAAASRIRSSRVALLLGHEGSGLSPDAEARASLRARIPIRKDTDSLNVATAAAIALYQVTSI